MARIVKRAGVTLVTGALLLVAALFAVQRWVGSDDFKLRAENEAAVALGVGVKLGAIVVDLWPVPALAVTEIQVQTLPALTLGRVEVRPRWMALVQGRFELSTVVLRRAVLAQQGIDSLLVSLQKKKQTKPEARGAEPKKTSEPALTVRRVVLDDVTWVNAKAARVTLDADVRLSADGLPDEVTAKVVKSQSGGLGVLQGVQADVHRDALAWTVTVKNLAGGTINGKIELQPAVKAGGEFLLKGQLETRHVDVAAFGANASRGVGASPLGGQLEAVTTLSARTASLGTLGDVVQTQSTFTVRNAVVRGIDLARAVTTVGLSRGGETRLDVLSGQVQTRGKAVQVSHLVASSGILSATGNVAIAPSGVLSGRVNVQLGATMVSGAVGVPLAVGGTLDAPEVTLTRAALLGAALGTAVLPGVGTGVGANMGEKLGDKLKGLFGR